MGDLTGSNIAHYKIIEQIGKGGMGVVYRAEDTSLDRMVALKFLPEDMAGDETVRNRFRHEAKAAATLNHPNIVTVHEVSEDDSGAFIAMELVEGGSLKKLMAAGELEEDKIIDLACQICEALSEAHQAGIVHRDLKPDNILLDSKGRVKIADFGLSVIRNMTRLTKENSTLGTLRYMSPEQLRSSQVDHRSDIFSFGIILYEMLARQLPFDGEYNEAITYSIMNDEPHPVARYRANVSPGMQHILNKALDKDVETRYQSMADVLADLKREKKDSSTPVSVQKPEIKIKVKYVTVAAIFLVGLIAIFLISKFGIDSQKPVNLLPVSHRQLTFSGKTGTGSLSPDGKFISFADASPDSGYDVFVKDISGGKPVKILSNTEIIYNLNWSPDGSESIISYLPFEKEYKTEIFPRLGGAVNKLSSMSKSNYFDWSPDGNYIASAHIHSKFIRFTSIADDKTNFLILSSEFAWFLDLDWNFSGEKFVFLTSNKEKSTIWTINLNGTDERKIYESSNEIFSPRWSANGKFIYFLNSHGLTKDLMKIDITLDSEKLQPELLQSGLQIGNSFNISSNNKVLLYNRDIKTSNLWSFDILNKKSDQSGEQITRGSSFINMPAISPDGSTIVFTRGKYPDSELYQIPVEGGQIRQLTFMDAYSDGAAWSPDGNFIAFVSNKKGTFNIWKINLAGGQTDIINTFQLGKDTPNEITWGPNWDILYRISSNQNYMRYLWKSKKQQLMLNQEKGWTFFTSFSTDGKKVAFYWRRFYDEINEYGNSIWIKNFESGALKEVIRDSYQPIKWSSDDRYIFARHLGSKIQVVKIAVDDGSVSPVLDIEERTISENSRFTISPDDRLLILPILERTSDIWIMEHFDPENETEKPIEKKEWPMGNFLKYAQEARYLYRQKKYAEAEMQCKLALEKIDIHPSVIFHLGWSQYHQFKYSEAEKSFLTGIEAFPKSGRFFVGLGFSKLRQQKYNDAEQTFLDGLALNENSRGCINGIGILNIEKRNFEIATEWYNKYLNVSKQNSNYAHSQLGLILLLQNNIPRSEDQFFKALQSDSTDYLTNRYLGYLYLLKKDYAKAEYHATIAFQQDTSFAQLNLLSFASVVGKKNINRGIKLAKQALTGKPVNLNHQISIYPFMPLPEYTLGKAYLILNNYEKAIKYLKQASILLPKNQQISTDLQLALQKGNSL